MAEADDLDAGLDALFATAPEGFVKAREALARELKRAGRADDAAEVHALRRPTAAVWGINQLAHARPERVAELVAAGTDVEARQHEGASARDELRAATRTRRALLDELTEAAAARTERPEATRASIAATLDAASLDADLQDDLLRGRLTTELSPAVRFLGDFGDLGDLGTGDDLPAPRRPAARSRRRTSAPPPRDELARRRAESALTEARTRAAGTDDALRDAEAGTREAEEALEAAHRRIADLEAVLADARADLGELKRRATETKRAETRARTAQQRAHTAVDVAARKVEESKGS
jgi:hypothetical protein